MADTVLDVEKVPTADQLQFHDVSHSVSDELLKSSKDGSQTHTFKDFPTSGADDPSDEEGDKTELLSGEKKQPSFWTFEYYQTFFDVDTNQVLGRIAGSMVPHPRRNYLRTKIRPNPDLYGPFWICATLTFTTAIAGNLANYIQEASAGNDYKWTYQFHKVTFAATAIFAYWWVVPTVVWGVLRWRGSQAGYTFLEIICVYGYSLAIYIPISILWVIPINALQWVLVMTGMVLSGTVLLFTFWPAVRDDDKKIAYGLMVLILLLHAGLAVGFVLYFFHVPSVTSVTSQTDMTKNSTETIKANFNPTHQPAQNKLTSQDIKSSKQNVEKISTNIAESNEPNPGKSTKGNKSTGVGGGGTKKTGTVVDSNAVKARIDVGGSRSKIKSGIITRDTRYKKAEKMNKIEKIQENIESPISI